jgi:uncharacterized membrane protein
MKQLSDGFDKRRIEALADGIFAFAMTLLVLDVKDGVSGGRAGWHAVAELEPALMAYVTSFLILGLYWTGHHAEFHYIRRTDRRHLWLNIALLMSVALLPFAATAFAQPGDATFGVFVYCMNLFAISGTMYAQWTYATNEKRLADEALSPEVISDVKRRILWSTVALESAILLALWDRRISFAGYIALQFMYVIRTTRTPTGAPETQE